MYMNGTKTQKKKRVRWTPDAERVLLQLWKRVFDELKTAKRKWNIYVRMATKMVQNGYNFTAYEIKMKLHNLNNKYKAERNRLKLCRFPISDWSLYKPLDYLLGHNRTHEWKELLDEYLDPLNEAGDELCAEDGGDVEGEEDNELKMEVENNDNHSESNDKEASDVVDSTQITYFSSDKDDNEDEQSESELARNPEVVLTESKESFLKETAFENAGNFRIIADRANHSSVTTSQVSNIKRPITTPKSFGKQRVAHNSTPPSLNQAKWQLIQLQKNKTLKEMEYRKKEFEQQSKEHELRLRHMEEEHQLRMANLRKQIKNNEANDNHDGL